MYHPNPPIPKHPGNKSAEEALRHAASFLEHSLESKVPTDALMHIEAAELFIAHAKRRLQITPA